MDNGQILMGFTGDVMIGRTVDRVISREGYAFPWGDVLPLLRTTDLNIINLETTLTTSTREASKVFHFKASPDRIRCLQIAGVGVANLANNHILDYEEEGLFETQRQLEGAGIRYAGAGANEEEAARPVLLTVRGLRLGILGATDNEKRWKAGPAQSGINHISLLNEHDRERLLATLRALRPQVDLLVVSIHWGPNLQETPRGETVSFGREMIRNGADIVHGHSAHNFQGIEVYNGKLILYDTGDFVDDYAVHPDLQNDHSFLYLVTAGPGGLERLQLVPVLIDGCQVNRAHDFDYTWCIRRIQQLSAPFGTKISEEGIVEMGNWLIG
ncbi:CapA family protein [Paraflavisolibacter sp. H34]|uniref:CapA family protein n=1 Tax=Huijunlia imazamoxiresistens TaxID=3127457 RepID=UPI003019BA6E